MSIDDDLDRLFQLPLSSFTAERNALAKRAGARAPEIRALSKPTAAIWAINQLHWREPDLYRDLVESAENLRATHKAVLAGRRGDLRAASRAHEEAVDAALKAALAIAAEGGGAPADATKQAIGTTLRALPGSEPPGRMTQAVRPGGFEMLAGLPAGGRVVPGPTTHPPRRPAAKRGSTSAAPAAAPDAAAAVRARKAAAEAARALASAEHAARREEFEAARAAREADQAQRRVTRAQEALHQAQAEVRSAEEELEEAVTKRDAARERSEKAERAREAARKVNDAAQREAREAAES